MFLLAAEPGDITTWLMTAIATMAVAIASGIVWYAKDRSSKDAATNALMASQQSSFEAIFKRATDAHDAMIAKKDEAAVAALHQQRTEFRETLTLLQQYHAEDRHRLEGKIGEFKSSVDALTLAISDLARRDKV